MMVRGRRPRIAVRVELDPALVNQLDALTYRKGITITQALSEAIKLWLEKCQ